MLMFMTNFLPLPIYGSILRPFLFLLYNNDMLQAVDCLLFLYAEDTYLLF